MKSDLYAYAKERKMWRTMRSTILVILTLVSLVWSVYTSVAAQVQGDSVDSELQRFQVETGKAVVG
jgi:hypothetical protein